MSIRPFHANYVSVCRIAVRLFTFILENVCFYMKMTVFSHIALCCAYSVTLLKSLKDDNNGI